MKTMIIKLNSKWPDTALLREVSAQLAQGKIVAFPTETVYGIGVSASHPEAVKRLRQLKERKNEQPLTYHIGNLGALERLNIIQSQAFKFLADQLWPGPVTFLALNQKEEKIGIRYPKNIIACELVNLSGELVVATSANRTGKKSPKTVAEVLEHFPNEIDVVVDGGNCEFGQDSTIVDTAQTPPVIVREGVWADRVKETIGKIKDGKYTRKRILIVCTGNTCRSPMAEGWLRAEIRHHKLADQIKVASCGIYARDGHGASMEAVLCLKNDEIDFEDFKTRMCRREDVLMSDLVLVMSDEHAKFISNLCPEVRDKIKLLNIADPMGLSMQYYEKSYQTIKEKMKAIWPEIIK